MKDITHAVVIDDEPTVLESLEQILTLADIQVTTFSDARDALPTLTADFRGVVVSDIRMPGMDGMSLLQAVDPGIPVILITGHGGIAQAVEAMKLGAYANPPAARTGAGQGQCGRCDFRGNGHRQRVGCPQPSCTEYPS